MNQEQKEAYLREYSILKNQGKPFFPYAVAKDSIMAMIVIFVIIFLALMFGAELGQQADPTTTTYVPRPDWYFFFLFEVLRVMKNVPDFTPMATIGVPTICMILLFLLPFYDRSPERLIWRRPIALSAGRGDDRGDGLPHIYRRQHRLAELGRSEATSRVVRQQAATFRAGELVVGQSGCLACHAIGDNGNNGPGPPLTHIGSKLPAAAIASTLRNPTAPMPSFKSLAQQSPEKFQNLVNFLSMLQ